MTATVLQELVDGVGVVSYNRPEKHNAIDDETAAAFGKAIDWAIGDPAVRCILVRGEGRSFSSGRDTTQLGTRARGESDEEFVGEAQQRRRSLVLCEKPVVAALRGYCLGGSFETALAADMRVGADDLQVGFPEIRFGLVPDTGGTQLLADLVGPARAKYLIMSGQRIGAEEALAWGVIDWLVPPDALDERALEIATQLAAAPPLAVRHAKRLVDDRRREAFDRTLREELQAQVALFASEDYAEARAAAREKRPPNFTGR